MSQEPTLCIAVAAHGKDGYLRFPLYWLHRTVIEYQVVGRSLNLIEFGPDQTRVPLIQRGNAVPIIPLVCCWLR